MKNILTVLILAIGLQGFAQDERLFDHTWYLHNLIIDGSTNIPPVSGEMPFIPLEFIAPDEATTRTCSGTSGILLLDFNGNTEFTTISAAFLLGSCFEIDNILYTNTYQGFWFDTDSTLCTYSIVEDGDSRTLTIINHLGNIAIYGNDFLSISDITIESFSIFPSPAEDILTIQKNTSSVISRIRINDISGKVIRVDMQDQVQLISINVEALETGIYFVNIENDLGQSITKKFVKR